MKLNSTNNYKKLWIFERTLVKKVWVTFIIVILSRYRLDNEIEIGWDMIIEKQFLSVIVCTS